MHSELFCEDYYDPKDNETISELDVSEGRYRIYYPNDYRNKIIRLVQKFWAWLF